MMQTAVIAFLCVVAFLGCWNLSTIAVSINNQRKETARIREELSLVRLSLNKANSAAAQEVLLEEFLNQGGR
jgi:hypothetical protein|nr:MAG TPA: hypothetical protein [Caudoviricetes sp.]